MGDEFDDDLGDDYREWQQRRRAAAPQRPGEAPQAQRSKPSDRFQRHTEVLEAYNQQPIGIIAVGVILILMLLVGLAIISSQSSDPASAPADQELSIQTPLPTPPPATKAASPTPWPWGEETRGWPMLGQDVPDASELAFNGKLVTLTNRPYSFTGVRSGNQKALCLIQYPQDSKQTLEIYVPCWRINQ